MADKQQKLNQVVAIEKGIKSRINTEITQLHREAEKPDAYYGFSKSYVARDAEGEVFPDENKKVVLDAASILKDAELKFAEVIDITATKDYGNKHAGADLRIGGQLIAADVPVPHLLFLEKEVTDIRTLVTKMPVLDESEDWHKEEATGLFKTTGTKSYKTAKLQKPIVLYDATDKHPAQTQLITEDVIVGMWTTVKASGAITKADKKRLLSNIEEALEAIKFAREEANGIEVTSQQVGTELMAYIFTI